MPYPGVRGRRILVRKPQCNLMQRLLRTGPVGECRVCEPDESASKVGVRMLCVREGGIAARRGRLRGARYLLKTDHADWTGRLDWPAHVLERRRPSLPRSEGCPLRRA